MKKLHFLAALALSTAFVACDELEDAEAFSDKLKVNIDLGSHVDPSVERRDNIPEKNFEMPSGSYITFNYSLGGELGFGSDVLTDIVSSLEITRETASGTTTCIAVPISELASASAFSEPLYESTKYTITATAKTGDKATQGPFDITITNPSKVFSGVTEVLIATEETSGGGNCFAALYFKSPAFDFSYRPVSGLFDGNFNPNWVTFSAIRENEKSFVISPSLIPSLGIWTKLNDGWGCWNNIQMQSIDSIAITDIESATYESLQEKVNITAATDKIEAVVGKGFMFVTPAGKKGLAIFREDINAPVYSKNISLDFVVQQ